MDYTGYSKLSSELKELFDIAYLMHKLDSKNNEMIDLDNIKSIKETLYGTGVKVKYGNVRIDYVLSDDGTIDIYTFKGS